MPRTALVALHGMGGTGPGMAGRLLRLAHERNWLVIAPTIPYGDWRDPNQLVSEELRLLPQLASVLDAVPAETGVPVAGRALLFGFSRGAQEALRFALLYPDRVEAVAGLSAGTYTLPMRAVKTVGGAELPAPLPFGVADLEQRAGRAIDEARLARVDFWVGVGARDNLDGDVPRQWDPFVGKNRVERAQRFVDAVANLGWNAQVAVVPGAGHEITPPMMELAIQFLADAAAAGQQQAEAAGTQVPVPAPIAPPSAPGAVARGI
jgi:pimeloyl-ACP methyl ester carboxylesterase